MDATKMIDLLYDLHSLSLADRIFIVENMITTVRENDEQRLIQLLNEME